jgi:hypothetical protein
VRVVGLVHQCQSSSCKPEPGEKIADHDSKFAGFAGYFMWTAQNAKDSGAMSSGTGFISSDNKSVLWRTLNERINELRTNMAPTMVAG